MGFQLAELFVSIKAEDAALSRSLSMIRSSATSTASGVGGALSGIFTAPLRAADALAGKIGMIGKGMALGGVVAALAGATAAIYKGVAGAMELQDTMSATDAIFGRSSAVIFKWSDDMAAKFGAVKTETIGAAQSFGQMFKAAGQSSDEAARTGTTLAKLGMDLASFKGGAATNKDAFAAIQGALQGNFQGNLDRYNVFLTMADVNQRAVAMGLARTTHEVDENAKKMATLNLIMEKTKEQQGDLERTNDQAHNSWQRLSGTMVNLATDVGTSLMPAISAVLNLGADAASYLSSAFEANKATFAGWGQTIVGWADTARAVFRNLGEIWEIVALRASAGFLNFLNVLAVIPENAAVIATYIGTNWYQIISDAVNLTMAVFRNFAENIKAIAEAAFEYLQNPAGGFHPRFTELTRGFAATVGEFPELIKPALVDVDQQVRAVEDRMVSRELARMASKSATTAASEAVSRPAQDAAKKAAEKEKEFKAETLGASDYFSKLREGVLSAKDDTAKRQLDEQKKTSENTSKLVEMVGAGALGAKFA